MAVLLICVGVLVAGALVLAIRGQRSPEAQPKGTTTEIAQAGATATVSNGTAGNSAVAQAARIELPPPDVPLDAVFDELADAADAGQVAAACRLAWDLQRCHRLEALAAIPGFYVEGAARAPAGSAQEDELIAEVVTAQESLAVDKQVCEGLPADRLKQAAGRMLQAARLGHPASQAMFASWPPFGLHVSVEEAELVVFHRDHAMQMLRTAAASGEPAALFGLFHACHFGEIRMLHGTIDVGCDPVCALAAATVLRGFADSQTRTGADEVIRESAAALDPAGLQEAMRLADFYRQRFADTPAYDFAGGIFKSQLRAPCHDLEYP